MLSAAGASNDTQLLTSSLAALRGSNLVRAIVRANIRSLVCCLSVLCDREVNLFCFGFVSIDSVRRDETKGDRRRSFGADAQVRAIAD